LTRQLFDESALPVLYGLLDDPDYKPHWPNVAQMIAYLGNEDSVPILEAYIARKDDLLDLPESQQHELMWSKVRSIQWVGMLGGAAADKLLREAMTADGAAALAANWGDSPVPPAWRRIPPDMLVRGRAAIGLILTRDPENRKLVEAFYEEARDEAFRTKDASMVHSSGLGDAMAIRSAIEEIGYEEYLDLLGDRQYWEVMTPYVRKFMLRVDE
jgi:hypothetical protein